MAAYYNEFDPFAAQWLRNLIAAGHIADGEVDERSIVEVQADDLRGFTQCHFFAGIGGWSYALRLAGWDDSRPVWTGSCPCQPFSVAGKGEGKEDERHLWPHFFRLIRECRPVACFGEQVASRDALAWLDHVCADLEGAAYTVGAVASPAAGYGAPHIRDRLYWVAHAGSGGVRNGGRGQPVGEAGEVRAEVREQRFRVDDGSGGIVGRLAHDDEAGRGLCGPSHDDYRDHAPGHDPHGRGEDGVVGCTESRGLGIGGDAAFEGSGGHANGAVEPFVVAHARRPGPQELGRGWDEPAGSATAGFWRDAEWIACRDGKARPVEPGVKPLASGIPARVGRLRGYGNAIVAPQAAAFVRAFLEVRG